ALRALPSRARALHRQRRDDRARRRAAPAAGRGRQRRVQRQAALGSGGVAFFWPSFASLPASSRRMLCLWRQTRNTLITATAPMVTPSSLSNQAKKMAKAAAVIEASDT